VTKSGRDVIVRRVYSSDRRSYRHVFRDGHVVHPAVKTRLVVVAVCDRQLESRGGRSLRVAAVGDRQPEPEIVRSALEVKGAVGRYCAGDRVYHQSRDAVSSTCRVPPENSTKH